MLRWAATLVIFVVSGCYSPSEPNCGFICGPDNACPEGFTCNAAEKRCHKNTAPADLTCESFIDAAPPVDMPLPPMDVPPIDAPPDAPPDAPIDAPDDAAPDAT